MPALAIVTNACEILDCSDENSIINLMINAHNSAMIKLEIGPAAATNAISLR